MNPQIFLDGVDNTLPNSADQGQSAFAAVIVVWGLAGPGGSVHSDGCCDPALTCWELRGDSEASKEDTGSDGRNSAARRLACRRHAAIQAAS